MQQQSALPAHVHWDGIRGGSGLALAMGLGRFFYTPVLPVMMSAIALSSAATAWIATANFVGYFLGSAVLARREGWVRQAVYRAGLVVTTLALLVMPVLHNSWWFAINRFIAGIASAVVFVCITHSAARLQQHTMAHAFVYAGVGSGIVLAGVVVLLCGDTVTWAALWWIAGAIGMALSALIWSWQVIEPEIPAGVSASGSDEVSVGKRHPSSGFLGYGLLNAVYFCEGFGYIIVGTFIVVLAEPVFGGGAAAIVWIMAGIAAVPAPVLWNRCAQRWGAAQALIAAYAIQGAGFLVPVWWHGPLALFIAAIAFGATFMGITMLTISYGSAAGMPSAAATLTTWYGLGQIVGPAVVALWLAENTSAAFALAAVVVAVALAGMVVTHRVLRSA